MSDCPKICIPFSQYSPDLYELLGTYNTEAECIAACQCEEGSSEQFVSSSSEVSSSDVVSSSSAVSSSSVVSSSSAVSSSSVVSSSSEVSSSSVVSSSSINCGQYIECNPETGMIYADCGLANLPGFVYNFNCETCECESSAVSSSSDVLSSSEELSSSSEIVSSSSSPTLSSSSVISNSSAQSSSSVSCTPCGPELQGVCCYDATGIIGAESGWTVPPVVAENAQSGSGAVVAVFKFDDSQNCCAPQASSNSSSSSSSSSVYGGINLTSNPDSANYGGAANWDGTLYGNVTTVGTNGGPSMYGTYDQSGNVWEWTDKVNLNDDLACRGGLGGTAFDTEASQNFISANYRDIAVPLVDGGFIGFRVATLNNDHGFNAANPPLFVDVADPNTTPDNTGYGAVPYAFKIGQYPVTNCEYVEFLNAIAADDTHNLYNAYMADQIGGIVREGVAGSYSYSTKTNYANKPVNWINWYMAARYCNWLHNNKPTGAQNASTTEDGAYSLLGTNPSPTPLKNNSAKYYIPTENEWYKAAYYQPGTGAAYWDYATASDTPPATVLANAQGDGDAAPPYYACAGAVINESSTTSATCNSATQKGSAICSVNFTTAKNVLLTIWGNTEQQDAPYDISEILISAKSPDTCDRRFATKKCPEGNYWQTCNSTPLDEQYEQCCSPLLALADKTDVGAWYTVGLDELAVDYDAVNTETPVVAHALHPNLTLACPKAAFVGTNGVDGTCDIEPIYRQNCPDTASYIPRPLAEYKFVSTKKPGCPEEPAPDPDTSSSAAAYPNFEFAEETYVKIKSVFYIDNEVIIDQTTNAVDVSAPGKTAFIDQTTNAVYVLINGQFVQIFDYDSAKINWYASVYVSFTLLWYWDGAFWGSLLGEVYDYTTKLACHQDGKPTGLIPGPELPSASSEESGGLAFDCNGAALINAGLAREFPEIGFYRPGTAPPTFPPGVKPPVEPAPEWCGSGGKVTGEPCAELGLECAGCEKPNNDCGAKTIVARTCISGTDENLGCGMRDHERCRIFTIPAGEYLIEFKTDTKDGLYHVGMEHNFRVEWYDVNDTPPVCPSSSSSSSAPNDLIAIFIDEASLVYTCETAAQVGPGWCADRELFLNVVTENNFPTNNVLVFDVLTADLPDTLGVWPSANACAAELCPIPIPENNVIQTARPSAPDDTASQTAFAEFVKTQFESKYGPQIWQFLTDNNLKITLIVDASGSMVRDTIGLGLNAFQAFLTTQNVQFTEHNVCMNERWLSWAATIIQNPDAEFKCEICVDNPLTITCETAGAAATSSGSSLSSCADPFELCCLRSLMVDNFVTAGPFFDIYGENLSPPVLLDDLANSVTPGKKWYIHPNLTELCNSVTPLTPLGGVILAVWTNVQIASAPSDEGPVPLVLRQMAQLSSVYFEGGHWFADVELWAQGAIGNLPDDGNLTPGCFNGNFYYVKHERVRLFCLALDGLPIWDVIVPYTPPVICEYTSGEIGYGPFEVPVVMPIMRFLGPKAIPPDWCVPAPTDSPCPVCEDSSTSSSAPISSSNSDSDSSLSSASSGLVSSSSSSSAIPLFNKQSWAATVPEPYKTYLDAAADRWEQHVAFDQTVAAAIKSSTGGNWHGINISTYTQFFNTLDGVDESNTLAACSVQNYVDLVTTAASVKFNSVAFNLWINTAWATPTNGVQLSAAQWIDVLTHELGHALGIGIFWHTSLEPVGAVPPVNNFLSGGSYTEAQAAYNEITGLTRPQTPLEDAGGAGTVSAHWENSYRAANYSGAGGVPYFGLFNELMVGALNVADPSFTLQLSPLSIGILRDFGYTQVGAGEGNPQVVSGLPIEAAETRKIQLNCTNMQHAAPEKIGTVYLMTPPY